MKAIVVREFGNPEVMKLEEVPNPLSGAGQVVVCVRAVGVNPYETYIRSGNYGQLPALPWTPGRDAAGVIESVGADVKNWKPGDRVYTVMTISGAYAEKTLVDAKWVQPLHERLSFAEGAALNVPYATAWRALFDRALAKPGETVLVHGATGGVGIAAVQFAVAHGMKVIGTGGSEEGRQLVRKNAALVLDHKEPSYAEEITRFTAGRGVDVIIEMLANVNLDMDLNLLAKFGRAVIVGNRGRIEIDPRQTMGKESSILGMNLWAGGDDKVFQAHAAIVAGVASGIVRPVVGEQLPLADAPRAHHEIIESNAVGKIVLVV